MHATRKTSKHPEGEAWPGNYRYVDGPTKGQPVEPCGDGCPDLERGACRPSGDLTEPVRYLDGGRAVLDLPRGVQYVVRETDAERCEEIAGEFYPNGQAAGEEPVEPAIKSSERERICELARRLGYNNAKTSMLIGQSAGDLAALERKLLDELDDQPERKLAGSGDNGHGTQPNKEISQAAATTTPNQADAVSAEGSASPVGGSFF
jgi:hypothetical protein